MKRLKRFWLELKTWCLLLPVPYGPGWNCFFLPLQDAAFIATVQLHGTEWKSMGVDLALRIGPAGITDYFANALMCFSPLYGRRPMSSKWERLFAPIYGWVKRGENVLDYNAGPSSGAFTSRNEKQNPLNMPSWVSVYVSRSDLVRFIRRARKMQLSPAHHESGWWHPRDYRNPGRGMW